MRETVTPDAFKGVMTGLARPASTPVTADGSINLGATFSALAGMGAPDAAAPVLPQKPGGVVHVPVGVVPQDAANPNPEIKGSVLAGSAQPVFIPRDHVPFIPPFPAKLAVAEPPFSHPARQPMARPAPVEPSNAAGQPPIVSLNKADGALVRSPVDAAEEQGAAPVAPPSLKRGEARLPFPQTEAASALTPGRRPDDQPASILPLAGHDSTPPRSASPRHAETQTDPVVTFAAPSHPASENSRQTAHPEDPRTRHSGAALQAGSPPTATRETGVPAKQTARDTVVARSEDAVVETPPELPKKGLPAAPMDEMPKPEVLAPVQGDLPAAAVSPEPRQSPSRNVLRQSEHPAWATRAPAQEALATRADIAPLAEPTAPRTRDTSSAQTPPQTLAAHAPSAASAPPPSPIATIAPQPPPTETRPKTTEPEKPDAPLATRQPDPPPRTAQTPFPARSEVTQFSASSALPDAARPELAAPAETLKFDLTSQPGTPPRPDPAFSRPEVPAQVSRQLVQIAGQAMDGPVELALNPEELGRVSLKVTSGEAGIGVAITAERPETLELMRRHIDQLARDFREMGFSGATFSFAQQRHDGHAQHDLPAGHPRAEQVDQPAPEASGVVLKMTGSVADGLDLRL